MTTKLYTVKEAIAILRIGRTKFYELLDRNELVTLKIDDRRLVPADAVERFIARKVAETEAASEGQAR
jgi:excisionase family DNA binding protein